MGFWVLASLAAVGALVVVIAALRHGAPAERARPAPPPASLPHPDEVADPVFPLAWQGYAPDHVDAWVTRMQHAYATAWRAADAASGAREQPSQAEPDGREDAPEG